MELVWRIFDAVEDLSKKIKGIADELETRAEKLFLHKLDDEPLFRTYVRYGRDAKEAADKSYSKDFTELGALNIWDAAEREWISRGFRSIHLCNFHKITESDVTNLDRFKRDSGGVDFYREWAKEIKADYRRGYMPFGAVHIGRVSDQ